MQRLFELHAMKINKSYQVSALIISWLCITVQITFAQAVPVKLIETSENNWQLLRNGEPYYVNGAAGNGSKAKLAEAGGNTFRTWGVGPDLQEQLDLAHELGLTVIVGHWLGHPRHGFDYNDLDMVADQFDRVRRDVLKYKDHPAVLIWSIGNEMEGYEDGDDAAIWSHVQALAAMIKDIDPNHPTMTVTAEIGGRRVKAIHRLCPDIDIMGINSYGGLPSVADRYKQQGGTKPILITEFGPPGVWEVGKTKFGAPPELTSTQKAEIYRNAYTKGCVDFNGLCLGGFAFIWGYKMEATSTWFGMFLPSGEKLAAVDVMTEIWTGKPPKNLCPVINNFNLVGPDIVEAGDTVILNYSAVDPEGKDLYIEWMVRGESDVYLTGGDAQLSPLEYQGIITKSSKTEATLVFPGGGVYRVYMKVHDGSGAAATANVPIKVNGEPGRMRLKLPLAVYADGEIQPWSPSGWMGNTEELKIDLESDISPHSGPNCIEINYKGYDGWAGVAWQHPPNDWGEIPGGYDLSGAKKLTFWARGKKGGERVDFGVGLLEKDRKYFDTAIAELKSVELNQEWKRYSIDLKGKDLTRIKTPFVWTISNLEWPVTFYLDDIRFE